MANSLFSAEIFFLEIFNLWGVSSVLSYSSILWQHLRGLKTEKTSFLSLLQVKKDHIHPKPCSAVRNGRNTIAQVAVLEITYWPLLTNYMPLDIFCHLFAGLLWRSKHLAIHITSYTYHFMWLVDLKSTLSNFQYDTLSLTIILYYRSFKLTTLFWLKFYIHWPALYTNPQPNCSSRSQPPFYSQFYKIYIIQIPHEWDYTVFLFLCLDSFT